MKLSELQIQKTCSDYLALDGWRLLRTDPCSDRRRGKGFGEVGMADCLYIRYGSRASITSVMAMSQCMWIEWKSAAGKPRPHQLAWHNAERARGALTLIAGLDFPASVEGFIVWYANSGLRVKHLKLA